MLLVCLAGRQNRDRLSLFCILLEPRGVSGLDLYLYQNIPSLAQPLWNFLCFGVSWIYSLLQVSTWLILQESYPLLACILLVCLPPFPVLATSSVPGLGVAAQGLDGFCGDVLDFRGCQP